MPKKYVFTPALLLAQPTQAREFLPPPPPKKCHRKETCQFLETCKLFLLPTPPKINLPFTVPSPLLLSRNAANVNSSIRTTAL